MVSRAFTVPIHGCAMDRRYGGAVPQAYSQSAPPCLVDRSEAIAASELMEHYGLAAAEEAAERAVRSREVGNYIHFCHWRQVARMIDFLAAGRGGSTLH